MIHQPAKSTPFPYTTLFRSSLRVGPQSAGADPGPASYGWGGTEPTLTDANVIAGRINPGYFLGDRKSTCLNSSHVEISYAVFCLKKKKDMQLKHTKANNNTT